jgi:hypothetical protein
VLSRTACLVVWVGWHCVCGITIEPLEDGLGLDVAASTMECSTASDGDSAYGGVI